MSKKKKKKKYKLQTHRGAKKRFRITGTGKILRMKSRRSHLRRKKASRVKQEFRTMLPLSPADRKCVRRALPGTKRVRDQEAE